MKFRADQFITVLIIIFGALLLYNLFRDPLIEGNNSRIDRLEEEVFGDADADADADEVEDEDADADADESESESEDEDDEVEFE